MNTNFIFLIVECVMSFPDGLFFEIANTEYTISVRELTLSEQILNIFQIQWFNYPYSITNNALFFNDHFKQYDFLREQKS